MIPVLSFDNTVLFHAKTREEAARKWRKLQMDRSLEQHGFKVYVFLGDGYFRCSYGME